MRFSNVSSLRPIRTASLIVAGLVAITGCSGDDASPSAAGRPAPTTTSTVSSVPAAGQSAVQLADSIGCADVQDRVGDPAEPVRPIEAVDCLLGESAIGVQVYRTAQDRAEVLRYLDQFAGFGVVGSDWIIEVDTPEAAAEVAKLTGGDLVDYSATTTTT
jgi:hypothetical protein